LALSDRNALKIPEGDKEFASINQPVFTETLCVSARLQNIFRENQQFEQIARSPGDEMQVPGRETTAQLCEIFESRVHQLADDLEEIVVAVCLINRLKHVTNSQELIRQRISVMHRDRYL
jgi:hypothetical protein